MTAPSSYAYQWKSAGSNATGPGATTPTYTPVSADIGNDLTCVVTGMNSADPTGVSVTTAATSAVTTTPTAPNVMANRIQGFVSSATEAGTAGTVAAWETLYGRHADVIQTYLSWATGTTAIQTVTAAQISDWGTRPYLLTVQPCGNPANVSQTSVVNWQDMIAGDYDTEIIAFADWINTSIGRTTYVRFAHEMNIGPPASWYTWQIGGNSGVTSAANYAAGFNHFASVMHAHSSYVQMVWCPNNNGSDPVPFYASGCDVMGFDAYNKPDPWDSDTTIFTTAYNYVASCDPDKPIWVCETACGEPLSDDTDDTKASWVTTMLNNSSFPRIAASIWFDIQYNTTNENYIMNSDSAATTAYYNGFVNSRGGAIYT
jgi:hypothetical protein